MKITEKKITFGLIVGTRGIFNSSLAVKGRKDLIELIEKLGFSYVILTPDATPTGAIETLEDARKCARLFNENGNIVIASFVSPLNELRQMVRDIIGNFNLVYAKCSLETCEKRDVKGMYRKARKGSIKQFTGVSAAFEEPAAADIIVDTENNDVEDCVKHILEAVNV